MKNTHNKSTTISYMLLLFILFFNMSCTYFSLPGCCINSKETIHAMSSDTSVLFNSLENITSSDSEAHKNKVETQFKSINKQIVDFKERTMRIRNSDLMLRQILRLQSAMRDLHRLYELGFAHSSQINILRQQFSVIYESMGRSCYDR